MIYQNYYLKMVDESYLLALMDEETICKRGHRA